MESLKEQKRCCICGFDKLTEDHHVIPRRFFSSNKKKVILCPNHHRMIHTKKYRDEILKKLLGEELVTKEEVEKVCNLKERTAQLRGYLVEHFNITKWKVPSDYHCIESFLNHIDKINEEELERLYNLVWKDVNNIGPEEEEKLIEEAKQRWKT